MATFSNQLYNAARYAAARPTYPKQLFDLIFKFHETGRVDLDASASLSNAEFGKSRYEKAIRWETAMDLGCGTGQATIELASSFKNIVGVDPSGGMLGSAQKNVEAKSQQLGIASEEFALRFKWIEGSVEKFNYPDESVDLVVSAQAAHWFNWEALWPRLARIVRPGGTVAIWGYSLFRIADHPEITPLINEYAQGSDSVNSLGQFWEQPGRSILDRLLVDVPRPSQILKGEVFGPCHELYFTCEELPHSERTTESKTWIRPPILKTHCSWESFESYLRTWSALDEYWTHNPGDKDAKNGDVVKRFMRQVQEGLRIGEDSSPDDSKGIDIEWPLVILMFKRSSD